MNWILFYRHHTLTQIIFLHFIFLTIIEVSVTLLLKNNLFFFRIFLFNAQHSPMPTSTEPMIVAKIKL